MLPLYLTTQVDLLKITLHPTLVKTCMTNKDAIESSGRMCLINVTRSPSMCMLHICVDDTWWLSASETLRGFVVTLLLITGVPSIIINLCCARISYCLATLEGQQSTSKVGGIWAVVGGSQEMSEGTRFEWLSGWRGNIWCNDSVILIIDELSLSRQHNWGWGAMIVCCKHKMKV